jgi:hypothetical protein
VTARDSRRARWGFSHKLAEPERIRSKSPGHSAVRPRRDADVARAADTVVAAGNDPVTGDHSLVDQRMTRRDPVGTSTPSALRGPSRFVYRPRDGPPATV